MNGWAGSSISAFKVDHDNVVECAHLLVPTERDLIDATGGVMLTKATEELAAVVCGGEDSYKAKHKKCFILNSNQDENQLATTVKSLNTDRIGAASLVIDYGKTLWVTGGFNGHGIPSGIASTEFVTLSGNISSGGIEGAELFNEHGPSFLKSNLFHHCLVKIGSEMAILIGGEYSTVIPVYQNIFCFSIQLQILSVTCFLGYFSI